MGPLSVSMLSIYLTIINAVFNIKIKALIVKRVGIVKNAVFCLYFTTKIANYETAKATFSTPCWLLNSSAKRFDWSSKNSVVLK